MTKDIDPATHMALVATLTTTIFHVLEATAVSAPGARTEGDRYGAAGASNALLAQAIEQVWGAEPAAAGAASVLGLMLQANPSFIGRALNSLSEDLGADLITKPKAEQLKKLQDFADAIAILDTGPDTDAMLCNVIERARDVSDQRPGGFKSPTPLNDIYRQGQKGLRDHEIPAPPWQAGRDNAKRIGWDSYFQGKQRDKCPFPPASAWLGAEYREGWDAAKAHDDAYPFTAPAEGGEA